MDLIDVNVLVYAHREDTVNHLSYRQWLEGIVNSDSPFGVADVVLSSFIRVVTHPRVFSPPSTVSEAWAFAEGLRAQPNCVPMNPGLRHWDIFRKLCSDADAKGNLVADAFLAAIAIENGADWLTTDRDFSRFPGLQWRHPLDR